MEKKINFNLPNLEEAILLWTGYNESTYPDRDFEILSRKFDKEKAIKLKKAIKCIEDDFYLTKANVIAKDLDEMIKIAENDFLKMHPQASKSIINALSWCYTYDYK